MTPHEIHLDAVEAAREWRDEERVKSGHLPVERVWLDTGSGPGYAVPVPHGEPWWTATECHATDHGPKRMIG